MERRAKHKVARWAGPVLGSLLASGCGGGDRPAPSAQALPHLSVEMPQVQEFGSARPLGDEDYRSSTVVPAQYPVPEWGAPASLEPSTQIESSPVTSMPNTMPGVPLNRSALPQESVEPDSVSIDEYLAARAAASAPIEPDSVSVEDYMALRAKVQAESDTEMNPVVGTDKDENYSPQFAVESVPEPTPFVERYTKPELPDFPTSGSEETRPQGIASDSLPVSPRAEDPAIYTPTTKSILPAEQQPTIQRLPEASAGPLVESPSPVFESHSSEFRVQRSEMANSLVMRTPARTPEMNGVVREAERHNGRGFDLATRGALLAARREFIEGLRIIALQLDKDGETKHFTQALAAGLAALDEADDFSPRGSRLEVELDLSLLVRGHRTPVLKGMDVKDLSPLVAAGRYYTYAQEQLGMVAGGQMAGSLALYGLGKVHDMINEQRLPQFNAPLPKAMVFHQAALTTDPRNFRAANDLGVLLARAGRMEIAKAMLEHSLRVTSQPAVWRNLAVIHDELGETQLSARAQQFALASQAEGAKAFPPGANPNTSRFAVQWVDPATFAASSRAASDIQPAPANTAAALNALPPSAKPPKASPSWSPWGNFPSATAAPAGGSKGFFTR